MHRQTKDGAVITIASGTANHPPNGKAKSIDRYPGISEQRKRELEAIVLAVLSENEVKPNDDIDPALHVKRLLQASRQYQQDWLECGVDRVHKYFDDVDGDWLELWGNSNEH